VAQGGDWGAAVTQAMGAAEIRASFRSLRK